MPRSDAVLSGMTDLTKTVVRRLLPRFPAPPMPDTRDTSMAQEWYIDADGRVEGPLSADELRHRAAAGLLRPADSVSADGVQWVVANTVPGLAFPARPPLTETVVSGSVP